ncbi:hypothetical protein K1T71_000946 [Dendrolimus kikuchii]|uniref:Uncharacterized protein n=1 Tax=Dendrolimus kikuchii TaxID=765133 RepID=A0ACC1DGD7_9NEOP|nr:hypothetical protein K1T71_000946 [Dendrolimus kikuchii]
MYYNLLTTVFNDNMSCQVKVAHGILQGKECLTYYGKKYYSFEGIPYAEPPVGKLRFRNPVPPRPWQGVLDATKPGNRCAQLDPYSGKSLEGSEDCLYLNVYTPCLPDEEVKKLAVLFFVHGGRLIFGYGDYYTPDYQLKHDVILVTINYRLNVLGFLCLDLPEAPGNAALKDMAFALRWVSENIDKFNGDRNRITISGESAGAAMAASCITSKMTFGLFQGLISQSSSLFSDLYLIDEDPIEKARNLVTVFGKKFETTREILDFLIDMPIDELLFAFSAVELSRPPEIINAYFLPVIEKEFGGVEFFFSEHPMISVKEGRFQSVPTITGYSSHEYALFLRRDESGNIIFDKDFYYFIPRFLHIKEGSREAKVIEAKIRKFYLNNKSSEYWDIGSYLKMMNDVYFNRDIQYFPHFMAKYVKNVYAYKFCYEGNMNTRVMKTLGIKGATHGDMIQYLFYREKKAKKASEKDIQMTEVLSEIWCNFTKTGKPTWTNQEVEWLPYSLKNRQTLVIKDNFSLEKDVDMDSLQFWLDIMADKAKLTKIQFKMAEGVTNPAYEVTEHESDIVVVFNHPNKNGELLDLKTHGIKEADNPKRRVPDTNNSICKGCNDISRTENTNVSTDDFRVVYNDEFNSNNSVVSDEIINWMPRKELNHSNDRDCVQDVFSTDTYVKNNCYNLNEIDYNDFKDNEEDVIKLSGPVFWSFRDKPVRNVWKRQSLGHESEHIPDM